MHIAFDGWALLFVISINGVLGLTVLLRNIKSKINTLYAFMVGTAILWSIINYASNHVGSHNLLLLTNQVTFVAGLLLMLAVWLMSAHFPRRTPYIVLQSYVLIPVTLLLSLLVFTPFIVRSISFNVSRQVTAIQTGQLYALYILGLLVILAAIIWNFRYSFKSSIDATSRAQVIFTAGGIVLAFIWIVLTSAVIPPLIHSWGISKIGSIGTIFFILSTGYAIVRHRLFDIRLIVARSVAYLMSLSTIGVGLASAAYIFTAYIFSSITVSRGKLTLVYTLLAMLFGLILPPLKRFFDKVSNNIFYRDAYDAQTFLDEFNKLLVMTYTLSPLLKKSGTLIEQSLKPSFTAFGIKETENSGRRIIGTAGVPSFSADDIAFVRSITPKLRRKIIIVDELEDKYAQLREVLRSNNIAIISRLSSSASEEGIGYLILGPKRSGNIYNKQDLRIIDIVSNELVIAIQNALRFEEIQNFNVTLQARVDEATRKLRKTNQKLKELDETKDDFISMASHQLRTPLTSVKGYISLVLEGDAGKINDQQRKLLEQSFFSSQRMVYLIADLLNVSRLKTGKFIIEPSPVNLADMVEQEMEQLKETAAAKGVTFTYAKPDNFPTLMLDETKTRQVVMNFADNAIYYTPAGGTIRVELNETPASVELKVVDDGIGVPKAEQHHLFTKFYRAQNARKARPDGTGLGLFMAKKVIAAQGGAVIFTSEENKGSTFGFVFSKTKLAPSGLPDPVEVAKAAK
ncbi:MAG TPA: ATP-binding protein [Candidatus Saccharimonadales bacterium]|nr:ATP-binding protein [Candidatus Saccharimonadales bacterium]